MYEYNESVGLQRGDSRGKPEGLIRLLLSVCLSVHVGWSVQRDGAFVLFLRRVLGDSRADIPILRTSFVTS